MQEAKFRMLMVDDVTRYQKLYQTAITDALPATVDFAQSGEEALEKLSDPQAYDLLILDLNMPGLGGEKTLQKLRQDPSYNSMPIIILTGETNPETHSRLLELGANDFIEKGSPPDLFVARLKAQMRHKLAIDRLAKMALDMDVFAAGVLHDIRNIETAIMATCQLAKIHLKDDPIGNRDKIYLSLDSLEEQAHRLGNYANDIIQTVRETSSQPKIVPLDITALINWIIETINQRRNSEGKEPITWEAPKPLKPLVADKSFLRLALFNIIQNSVRYSREGVVPHITITQDEPSEVTATLQKGRRLVTRVRDNGIGIPESSLRKVFEPFIRGNDVKNRESGHGLGLALVTKVIGNMGGKVWAEVPADKSPGAIIAFELQTP